MNNLKTIISRIVKNKQSHAKWLNSISYLEYTGVRKIMKSQTSDQMSELILSHVFEEARHALFFKKLAKKIGGSQFTTYQEDSLLCPEAFKNYFYSLDHGVHDFLLKYSFEPQAVYFFVTWLIEVRAVAVYKIYQEILDENQFGISLAPVLADESKHLSEVVQGFKASFPEWSKVQDFLISYEEKCFQKLWFEVSSQDFVVEVKLSESQQPTILA